MTVRNPGHIFQMSENMRYDKLTLKSQEALQEADSLAHSFNHSTLEAEHLLLALLEQKDGVIPPALERIGADAGELAAAVRAGALQKAEGDTGTRRSPA